ncbi:MAG: redoxin domain-containing protein [Acidobacteria bacterium]|nr:redoxin domain-containing protein [Acidobacteriota bacterium]
MRNAKWLALCVGGLTLALIVLVGLRDIKRFRDGAPAESADASGKELPTIRFVKDPQPAPAMALTDLDGKPLSSINWRGKVVLLNFWATWCGPCRAEIPDLIRLQEKYPDKLLIVGLSQDLDPPAKVKQFADEMNVNYPVAMSTEEIERSFGGVFGLPTSFILDTEGRIVQKHIGLRDPVLYENEIRALLDLPVDAKVERFDDTGQVLLSNAKNATEYPGVDLSKLNGEQKKAAQRQLNEQQCNCGCGLTVAQCLVNDTSCEVSKEMAAKVVEELLEGKPSLAPDDAKP